MSTTGLEVFDTTLQKTALWLKEIMAELLQTRDSEVCYNVSRERKSLFLCVRPDWSRCSCSASGS